MVVPAKYPAQIRLLVQSRGDPRVFSSGNDEPEFAVYKATMASMVKSQIVLYAALNQGLARVRTEYVQQCGVDDEAYWRTHERVAALLGSRRPAWIAGRCETRHLSGRRTGAGVYRQLLHRLAPLLLPLTNVVGSPAVIFSAAAARRAGGWDESMPAAADYDLWLKLHAQQRPFLLPFATGRFLVRPESSLTRAHRRTSLEDCYRSRRQYFHGALVPGLARGVQSAQFKLQDLLGE